MSMSTLSILIILVIIIAIIFVFNFIKTKYSNSRPAQSRAIFSDVKDPKEWLDLIVADTFFTDYPNTYSNSVDFGESMIRGTHAFLWAGDGNDTTVADKIIEVALPTFASKIAIEDFTKGPKIGINWYQYGETIRKFYNSLWYYKPDALPDLKDRISTGNSNLDTVKQVPQHGSNFCLLATQRAWYLKYIEGVNRIFDDIILQGVFDNLPIIETDSLWPKTDNITPDGSYNTHGNVRGYGYILNQLEALNQINLIESDSIDLSKFNTGLNILSTRTGLINPGVLTRVLNNEHSKAKLSLYSVFPNQISIIEGERIIVASFDNWSFCSWANNSTLAAAELDIGVSTAFNAYTTPYNFSINTVPYKYVEETFHLVPGVLYPVPIPSYLGNTTISKVSKTVGVGIVSFDKMNAFISDSINISALPPVVNRYIYIFNSGIKVALQISAKDDATTLFHTLYSGTNIVKQGSGWIVDNNVYVSGTENYKLITDSGVQVLRAEIATIPTTIYFNILYSTVDDSYLKFNNSNYNIDVSVNNVLIRANDSVCGLKAGNSLAVNPIYDKNTRSSSYDGSLGWKFDKLYNAENLNNVIAPTDGQITIYGSIA